MKKYFIVLFVFATGIIACNLRTEEKLNVMLPPPPAEKAVEFQKFVLPVIKEDNEAFDKDDVVTQAIEIDSPPDNADLNVPDKLNRSSVEKKIIKEGEIRFETGDVIKTRKQITTALKQLGGYAEDDSETTDGAAGSKEYTLLIRLPANNFDAFLGAVSSTATKVDSRNIRIKDVTTQFIDTKARLDNKLQLEKRYLNLLNRAGKMRDLLDIEEKLTEIRSDIDATQGQLNYMSKQVAFSSLNITFYTKQPEQVAAGNGFGYKFKNALTSGFDFLENFFFGLLSNWPLLIMFALVYVLVRRWRRNKALKQA